MTNAKRYKQKDKEKGDRGRDKHTQRQTQRDRQIVTKKRVEDEFIFKMKMPPSSA